MWVNVGGHDLFLVGVGAYDLFFWLHLGKCDLFLAGCGCVWVSVNFF